MSYPYVVLDVFTDRPLAGNPLAVLPEALGLDEARMQAIAAEFNLSETVFVFPPERPVHSARIRIFTPRQELPFAGHPTIGTALVVARRMAGSDQRGRETMLMLEENVGAVRCGVFIKNGNSGHVVFDAPRLPEPVAVTLEREALAAALGLTPGEIGFENHQPSAFTAGVPYAFVPVRGLDAIARAKANSAAWAHAFSGQVNGAFLYCRETVGLNHGFHARMFAPELGIVEDPATGSAAVAFAGVVQRFDEPTTGKHRTVIEQGFEMRRPSLMTLEIDIARGEITVVRLGGDAVVVAEGLLDV